MKIRPTSCKDCGVDTTPDGWEWEWYMVLPEIWGQAGMPYDGYLCIGCIEQRLGRQLIPADFRPDLPINDPGKHTISERLRSRLAA